MHILLAVLSAVGKVLLVLLILALMIVLMIMFIPVRYSICAEADEKISGRARVTWLFRLINVSLDVPGKGGIYSVSVKAAGHEFVRLGENEEDTEPKGSSDGAGDIRNEDDIREEAREITRETDDENTERKSSYDEKKELNEISAKETIFEDGTASEGEKISDFENDQDENPEDISLKRQASYNKIEDGVKEEITSGSIEKDDDPGNAGGRERAQRNEEHKSLFSNFRRKVAEIMKSLEQKKEKIVSIWSGLKKKTGTLKEKARLIERFYESEAFRNFVPFAKRKIFCIIRHAAPKKTESDITFGMDDPSDTGMILGAVYAVTGAAGVRLDITPDFEKKILQGYVKCRGRIFLFYVTAVALSFLADHRFRDFKKKYKHFRSRFSKA